MRASSLLKDEDFMRRALRLARRGYGKTSPNPMVGALLVRSGRIIGYGWHHRAGESHAEIEALNDARSKGNSIQGATLYVTLEPCSTQGRTPPCTAAIIQAGIRRVVAGATDPNPKHRGKGFRILGRAGIEVTTGVRGKECSRLNEAFNHWVVYRTPFVLTKAAMTLDGKIAAASGESKWITGEAARGFGMRLRLGADAILVGINTVLADDPSLTVRVTRRERGASKSGAQRQSPKRLRRIVLDTHARTPPGAKVVTDADSMLTTIVVSRSAPRSRVAQLSKRVQVLVAPTVGSRPAADSVKKQSRLRPGGGERIDLKWLLRKLGAENVTSLLVEGGGEINASFLMSGLAQRIAFFYAPKILGGRDSLRAVGGEGATNLEEMLELENLEWRKLGEDWMLTATIDNS
jgi:diaminohydroxyphosphoribosylaminopyrimidine deaminase/5-amino-6-(5-phosphoribosylamino)uracil reductase